MTKIKFTINLYEQWTNYLDGLVSYLQEHRMGMDPYGFIKVKKVSEGFDGCWIDLCDDEMFSKPGQTRNACIDFSDPTSGEFYLRYYFNIDGGTDVQFPSFKFNLNPEILGEDIFLDYIISWTMGVTVVEPIEIIEKYKIGETVPA